MFELILGLLKTALDLWLSKEKTKYIDQMMSLKQRYYEEYNKPESERSDAELDYLLFELRNLAIAFTAQAGIKDLADQQNDSGTGVPVGGVCEDDSGDLHKNGNQD